MEREAFDLLSTGEVNHWWFRFRRELIEASLRSLSLGPETELLDAGCGSGGNLELLGKFGRVWGFEFDTEALQAAQLRGQGEVAHGSLPDGIPFGDRQFDVIGLFDVLEHLEHPVESLAALRRRLRPGGALLITVPANQWLWGPHDELHQHFRRYSRRSLRLHIEGAGLRLDYVSSYNMLVLPLAVAQRIREKVFGYSIEALDPSPGLNRLLLRLCRNELRWLPERALPAGLSLIAFARNAA